MKKEKVLAVLDRRIQEAHKIGSDPDTARDRRVRAWGAYHALLQVKFEIEDMDTRREGRGYLTIV